MGDARAIRSGTYTADEQLLGQKLAQILRAVILALKADGWVEDQEFDLNSPSDGGTIPADGKMKEWEALWNQAVESAGMTGSCDPRKMAEQMKDAGFIKHNS